MSVNVARPSPTRLAYAMFLGVLCHLVAAGSNITGEIDPERLLKLAVQRVKENTLALSRDGRVVVPAGAMLHGRVLRIVRYAPPYNTFELVLKLDRLTVGEHELPIHLSPPQPDPESPVQGTGMVTASRHVTGVRPPLQMIQGNNQLTDAEDDRRNGTGTFEFPYTNHLHLAVGYKTDWVVN